MFLGKMIQVNIPSNYISNCSENLWPITAHNDLMAVDRIGLILRKPFCSKEVFKLVQKF